MKVQFISKIQLQLVTDILLEDWYAVHSFEIIGDLAMWFTPLGDTIACNLEEIKAMRFSARAEVTK